MLLLVATWSPDDDFDAVWRAFGVCGLIALCGSHASLVLRAQRPEDPPLVTTLVWTSIVTATFSTLVGDIAIIGLVDDIDEDIARFVAAVLVVALLSTALPPILRRVGHAAPAARGASHAGGRDHRRGCPGRSRRITGGSPARGFRPARTRGASTRLAPAQRDDRAAESGRIDANTRRSVRLSAQGRLSDRPVSSSTGGPRSGSARARMRC